MNIATLFKGENQQLNILQSLYRLKVSDDGEVFLLFLRLVIEELREHNDSEMNMDKLRITQGKITAIKELLFLFDNCNQMIEDIQKKGKEENCYG